jgi:hypothetical protein
MPYCPKCRFEYLPTVHHCPDCGAALVVERPPEPDEHALDDVVLCTVGGEAEAAALRGRLAAQGIPSRAQLSDVTPLIGVPMMSPGAQAVKVFVRKVDAARARAAWRRLTRHPHE